MFGCSDSCSLLSVEQHQPNLAVAHFGCRLEGQIELHALLRGVDLKGSPVHRAVQPAWPSAAHCTAAVPSSCVAGDIGLAVLVQLRNQFGNTGDSSHAQHLEVRLCQQGQPQVLHRAAGCASGSCTIPFQISQPGVTQVHVLLRGEHVGDSPFELNVMPPTTQLNLTETADPPKLEPAAKPTAGRKVKLRGFGGLNSPTASSTAKTIRKK